MSLGSHSLWLTEKPDNGEYSVSNSRVSSSAFWIDRDWLACESVSSSLLASSCPLHTCLGGAPCLPHLFSFPVMSPLHSQPRTKQEWVIIVSWRLHKCISILLFLFFNGEKKWSISLRARKGAVISEFIPRSIFNQPTGRPLTVGRISLTAALKCS